MRGMSLMCMGVFILGGSAPAQATPTGVFARSFSDLNIRAGDVFEPSFARVGDRVLVGVEIAGVAHTLDLRPFSLRSPDARVLLDIGGGRLIEAGEIPSRTYRGRIAGLAGASVSASVMDGFVRAIVSMPDGSLFAVQELERGRAGAHVAYALRDVLDAGGVCGNELEHGAGEVGEIARDPGPAGTCNLATLIATDSDHEMYLLNGSDVQATIDDVESIINGMDFIYTRDTRVTYVIGDHVVRVDPNDPYTTSDPGGLRGQFQSEWNNNQQAIPRDIAHLFTGRDIDGGVIGIAFFDGVCSSFQGYALSQTLWSNTFSLRVGLTAHELGHNWNAMHCNNDPDCFIMCSGINGCAGDVTLFGSRSIATIINYANNIATCLDGTDSAPPVPPRANDDEAGSVAGEVALIDVLGNDTEGNCQDLSIGAFDSTTTLGGTVELSIGTGPDGRDELRYAPPPGIDFGIDTFTYEASDPDGNTSEAEVRVILTTWLEPGFDGATEAGVGVGYYDLSDLGSLRELPNFDQLTPFLEEVVADIDYPETGGNFAGSGLSEFVGALYEGVLIVEDEDIYTLFLNSTDGSRLFLDGMLVVDNDGLHNMREEQATFGLRAGAYRLRLEYFENRGTAGLIFSWRSNAIAKQVVPAGALGRAIECPADIDGDGDADADDFFAFLDAFSAGNFAVCDVDGDGDCDADDFFTYLDRFTQPC